MILYIGIAAVTVLAAAMVKETAGSVCGTRGRAVNLSCLFLIFLVLTVPAVLRQETGNDYLRYVEFFHLASIDEYVPTEEGFNLLVKLIYSLCGYENYLLVFAVFAVGTIAMMLTAIRQQAEDFLFSFFLFMMFGYYFQSFNTMRYYFALSIVMVAMTYFIRRQYAAAVLLVLAASLFHKSALVVLILYPLAAHLWRIWQILAVTVLGVLALIFSEQVMTLLLMVYPSWEDTVDLAAGTSVSWVNIARCAGALILLLMVQWLNRNPEFCFPRSLLMQPSSGGRQRDQEAGTVLSRVAGRGSQGEPEGRPDSLGLQQNRQLRIYVNASWLGLMIYIFGWFIPEVSRICYYLTFTQIFLFPMLLDRIPREQQRLRRWLRIAVIAAAILYFAMFLRAAYGETTKILPYKSFLFHDLSQTPSGSIE